MKIKIRIPAATNKRQPAHLEANWWVISHIRAEKVYDEGYCPKMKLKISSAQPLPAKTFSHTHFNFSSS
ncbi:MAG: hypothetical protein ABFC91_04695 [Methanobacteriaceae archaeon]